MLASTTPSPAAADKLINQGLQASQAGDSSAALTFWQQASQAAPHSGIPHFLMASELAAMGDIDRAEAEFANAVLLAPGLLIARYQLGLLQFSSGRAALALVTWAPLLQEIAPEDPIAPALAQFVLGYTALAQNECTSALHHYEEGLRLNTTNEPLSHDIRLVMQRIHALLDSAPKESPATAAVATEEATPPDNESSHVLLANYQAQGKPH